MAGTTLEAPSAPTPGLQEQMGEFAAKTRQMLIDLEPKRSPEDITEINRVVKELTLSYGVNGREEAEKQFQKQLDAYEMMAMTNKAVSETTKQAPGPVGLEKFGAMLGQSNLGQVHLVAQAAKKLPGVGVLGHALETLAGLESNIMMFTREPMIFKALGDGIVALDGLLKEKGVTVSGAEAQKLAQRAIDSDQVQGVLGAVSSAVKQVGDSDQVKAIASRAQQLVATASNKASTLPDLPAIKGLKDLVMGDGEDPSSGLHGAVKTAAANLIKR